MKKSLALIMTMIMLLSLVACNDRATQISCPNCKTNIYAEALFCSNCGVSLKNEESTTEKTSTNEDISSSTKTTVPSKNDSTNDTTATEHITPSVSHTHQYSSKTISPACESDGFIQHTCACGHSYKDNYVKAIGHNWNDATCTISKTCKLCGKTSGEPLTHNYANGICTYCNCYDYIYVELARDAYEYMNAKYGLTTYDVATITGGEIDGKPAVKFYYGYITYFTYNEVTGRVTSWSVGNVEYTEYFRMDVKSVLGE